MLKWYFSIFLFLIMLVPNCYVSANSPLEKKITDVLDSETFLIQFSVVNKLTNVKNADVDAWNQYEKDHKKVFTAIKFGNDRLLVIDSYKKNKLEQSASSLYKDGISYTCINFSKSSINHNGLVTPKGMPITKMYNDSALKTYESIINNMFLYHLQPLFPERNYTIDINGKVVLSNYCNEFVKDGKEVIGGQTIDFIEYKVPESMGFESIGRYYLLNGIFTKYLRFDKDKNFAIEEEWQKVYGTDTYGYGGYAILDIKKFTKAVNPNLLQIPKGAKLYEVKLPTNLY